MPSLSNFILYVILITHTDNPALPLSINDSLRTPVIATLPPSVLLVACVSYGLGVGAVPYTMIGEVFPPQYRTLGSCLAQVVRTTTVFLIVKVTPHVLTTFGLYALFLFHGVICALASIFARIFLPETRGKTLAELCSLYK